MNVEQKGDENSMIKETANSQENILDTPNNSLKQIIGSLIEEVRQLKGSFHLDYAKWDNKTENQILTQKGAPDKLEFSIESQRREVTTILTNKIENNATNISQLLGENRLLKRENVTLRECITKIEIAQMRNNIL